MADDIRPPHVSFEVQPVEDRALSLKTGVYMTKDVDFIKIIPHGSEGKTCLEYVYSEWLERTRGRTGEQRASGAGPDTPLMGASRFPPEWLRRIEESYKAWKEGFELPVEGKPLRTWPPISPSQLKNCEAMHVRTVEELANASDDVVESIGMGGNGLRQRAKDWVAAERGGIGPLTARLEATEVELKNRDAQIAALSARVNELAKKAA